MNITEEKTYLIRAKLNKLIGYVTARHIFGGYGLFKDKNMFALYKNDIFYLRATGDFIQTLLMLKGKKYSSTIKDIAYISIPAGIMKDYDYFKELLLFSIGQIKSEQKQLKYVKKDQIKELANFNIKYERLLNKVGIETVREFRRYGAVNTYILLLKANIDVNLNVFWRLIAAIEQRHYSLLTREEKLKHLKILNYYLRFNGMKEISEDEI